MLIITGTQRSGTTMMAQFLEACGFKFSENVDWDGDINGGYEDMDMSLFFREYIGDDTFPFEDIKEIAKNDRFVPSIFPNADVVKFAYFMQCPFLIHIFHKLRQVDNDKFLIMTRNLSDVEATKKRRWDRFKYDSVLLQQTSTEMICNWSKATAILDKYNYKRAYIRFPDCVDNFSLVKESMDTLGYDISKHEDLFYSMIDKTKIHHWTGNEDFS